MIQRRIMRSIYKFNKALGVITLSMLFVFLSVGESECRPESLLVVAITDTNAYTKDNKIYGNIDKYDLLEIDRQVGERCRLAGMNLWVDTKDLAIGNQIVDTLNHSNLERIAVVVTKNTKLKKTGLVEEFVKVKKNTKFSVTQSNGAFLVVKYGEDTFFVNREDVHILFNLKKWKKPEHGLYDTEYYQKKLEESMERLAQINSEIQRKYGVDASRYKLVEYAKEFVGYQYVWGASNPQIGFDCSGLVQYVYSNFGVNLPRTSYTQVEKGTLVDEGNAKPGDLLFFYKNKYNRVGHVAIYIGNEQMIEAKGAKYGVVISSVDWDQVYKAKSVLN